MKKTNREMLEELYCELQFEKTGFIGQNVIEEIQNALELNDRSMIDCKNLHDFNTIFYEHMIGPVYNQIDKLINGNHINDRVAFDNLLDMRDRYRRVHEAIELVVENHIFEMKD